MFLPEGNPKIETKRPGRAFASAFFLLAEDQGDREKKRFCLYTEKGKVYKNSTKKSKKKFTKLPSFILLPEAKLLSSCSPDHVFLPGPGADGFPYQGVSDMCLGSMLL